MQLTLNFYLTVDCSKFLLFAILRLHSSCSAALINVARFEIHTSLYLILVYDDKFLWSLCCGLFDVFLTREMLKKETTGLARDFQIVNS